MLRSESKLFPLQISFIVIVGKMTLVIIWSEEFLGWDEFRTSLTYATFRYVTFIAFRFAIETYHQSKLFAFLFSKVINRVESGYRLPSPKVSLFQLYAEVTQESK